MASYVDIRALFGNESLRSKVEVACAVAANAIRTEDAGTANHANRLLWAKRAWTSPVETGREMLIAVLAANADLTTAAITGATDAAILTAVSAAVDVFADGS